MTTESDKKLEGPQWAHIELFGFRQLVGTVEDVIRHGVTMVAIRPLLPDGTLGDVEYKGGAAFYGDKPITQERARYLAGCTDKLLPVPEPAATPDEKLDGVEMIRRVRDTHRGKGYDAAHDAEHTAGELAKAAAVYAAPVDIYDAKLRDVWPWSPADDHRKGHTRVDQLAIAGAFCAAEIDRLKAAEQLGDEPPCTSCGALAGEDCAENCTADEEHEL